FLPGPPASNQCYPHGHRYNAIDQQACVFFAPGSNLHTQRNELIRLSDFLAGQTLFSHSIAPFVTFWNHAILESMLARLATSGRFFTQRDTGRRNLPVWQQDLRGDYASSCLPLATTACIRCCGRTS